MMHDGKYSSLDVGFIGCGKIAHCHADVLTSLGVKISSVCGTPTSSRVQPFASKYGQPKIYSDYTSLISSEKPDAFWVVPSWNQVQKLLLHLIHSDIPCFFEKPAALDSSFLEEAIKESTRLGHRSLVGYNRRFYDFVDRVKFLIGRNGLTAAEIHLAEQTSVISDTERKALMPHLWIYSSSHVLDLLLYLVGEIKVESIMRKRDSGMNISNSVHGLLRASRYAAPIHLFSEWDAPLNANITLLCGSDRIVLAPLERMQVYRGMRLSNPTQEKPVRSYEPILVEEAYVDTSFKPGFLKQAMHFLDKCVLRLESGDIGCTLTDAYQVTKLCESITGTHFRNPFDITAVR